MPPNKFILARRKANANIYVRIERGFQIMARANTNKAIDALVARRKARIDDENDRDYNFLIEVLEGRVQIWQNEKDRFIMLYQKLLDEGQYIGKNREGKTVLSNKHPDRLERQRAKFDEIIESIFTRVIE